jgi:endothelin-converting enzyme/putative endopeptidase
LVGGIAAAGDTAVQRWSLDRSTFDLSVDPCSDFYQHVCGSWSNPDNIPADLKFAVWADTQARRANDADLKGFLLGKTKIDDPEARRLRTFVAACMSQTPSSEAAALKTAQTWLSRFDDIETREQFQVVLRDLHAHGVNAFFSYSGQPDTNAQSRNRGEILQGGLGLRRLAYADKDAVQDRARYRDHVSKMFALAGLSADQAGSDAEAVLRLETTLAAHSLPYFDQFDAAVSEHPIASRDLATLAPHFDWASYLDMVGQPATRAMNVASPDFVRTVDKLLANSSIAELRAFLRWRFLDTFAAALPAPWAMEQQRFVAGSLKPAPRFEFCRLETLKNLGVELSRQFSNRFIGPMVRDKATAIAAHVQDTVVAAVPSFLWLSPDARVATKQRVRKLDLKVGYPDQWPDTGTFALSDRDFLANVIQAQAYEQRRLWARVEQLRGRDSWETMVYPNEAPGMAAARLVIANGFPDQTTNSIILTAAGLRTPMFDGSAPKEVQYGTFGFLVGHELGHILENHDYDADGEPKESWGAKDSAAHDEQTACLIRQADEYVAAEGAHLDGKKTAGENFGDLSGIYSSYLAMTTDLGARAYQKGPDGYSPVQRFFIGYAQHWCTAERADFARESLRDDGHAPARFRTNAPLSNMPAFARAFSCPNTAPMVRPTATRCSYWGLAMP